LSVTNGQPASAEVLNGAFVSKTSNSTIISQLTLNRSGSGDQITDAQLQINQNKTASQQNTANIATLRAENPLSNMNATNDPASTNDSTQGYLVGSKWFNVSSDFIWMCIDSTPGAAIWKQIDAAGGAGGGGSSLKWVSDQNAPIHEILFGSEIKSFDSVSGQEIYATIKVPSSYEQGTPIFLRGLTFFSVSTTGEVAFNCITALVRDGNVFGVFDDTHASALPAFAVGGVVNQMVLLDDIDLTDATGQINLSPIQSGDTLLIKLFRDIAIESPSASEDAKVLIDALEPVFSEI
jgi:hypothetical protein